MGWDEQQQVSPEAREQLVLSRLTVRSPTVLFSRFRGQRLAAS
jgi:hypothetical protein